MEADDDPVTLSLDVIFEIFDLLDLSAYELAPYRRCCRAMHEMMTRLVRRLDTTALPELRLMYSNNWVENIVRVYPNLEVVQLSGIEISDDEAILFAGLSKLKEIDLYECNAVGDSTITTLATQCPNLESLILGGSLRRHGAKITNLSIHALAEHASSLQDLHLTSCYLLTDDAIVTLAEKRGSRLRSISLSRCAKITDISVIKLAMHSPKLQSVGVNECFRLTSAAVIALASSCHNLVSVNMRGTRVTDDAIEALAMKCPLLEAVNLECCLQLTDAGVMTLGTRATRPSEWNDRYNEQPLSSTIAQQNTMPPSDRPSDEATSDGMDDDFELFAMRLKNLSVSGCVRLTDASIVSVAQSCHHLATVDLSQVYDLTDASVVALASNCGPHLISLKLSRCGRITDYAIAAVAGCCPGLRQVSMDDCYGLTDASIEALATKCSLLEEVDISHCAKLTDASVFALTAYSRRLVRLDMKFPQTSLGGPSLLTPSAVIALATLARQPRSTLRFVDLSGHPRLLSPEAAAAIALAEQSPPAFNSAGGGATSMSNDDSDGLERQTGSLWVVTFLVDNMESEEEPRDDNSYLQGNFAVGDPLNDFSSLSNNLPPSDSASGPVTTAEPLQMHNQHSLWNGTNNREERERKSVVQFDLPDGNHDSPVETPERRSSTGGSVRGRAKQFLRTSLRSTFNLLGGVSGEQSEKSNIAEESPSQRLSRKSSGGSSSSLKKKRKSNK